MFQNVQRGKSVHAEVSRDLIVSPKYLIVKRIFYSDEVARTFVTDVF